MGMKNFGRKLEIIFFLLLWGGYLALTLLLFHRQTVYYGGGYASDIGPYVSYMQGIDVGYEYPYPIMFWVGRFFMLFVEPRMALAFAVTFLNGLTVPILKYYIGKYMQNDGGWTAKKAVFSTALTFSMLFVSMLFMDLSGESIGWRYRGVFSPNPYHNATYLVARPFSIVCFFMFADLLHTYEKEVNRKKYLLFALFLLLSTMTKPSFMLGFVVTAALLLFYRTCRCRFRNFAKTMCLAACALPAILGLLYQFGGVFTGKNSMGEEAGIGFGFLEAWSMQEKPVGEALLLGLALPVVVLLFNWKSLKEDGAYRLSWQYLVVNLAMLLFLYEKGYRKGHVNFAWGYMYAMFFSYLMSALVIWRSACKKAKPVWAIVLQAGVYVWHLVCGIVYFSNVMSGGMFL